MRISFRLAPLLLLCLFFASYLSSLTNPLVGEDLTQSRFGLKEALEEATGLGWSLGYRPMAVLFWAVSNSLFQGNPLGYRLVVLALHGLNGLFLYYLVKELTSPLVAFFTLLLFFCAPFLDQSIFWLSGAFHYLLYSFFFLLSCLLFLKYLSRPSPALYLASLAFSALAFLTMEMAIAVPLFLLFLEWRRSQGDHSPWMLMRRHGPFWLLLLAYGFFRSWFLGGAGGYGPEVHSKLGLIGLHFLSYLRDLFAPFFLGSVFGHLMSLYSAHPLSIGLLLMAFFVGMALIWKASRLALAWFFLALLPGLTFYGQRALYLASVGFLMLVVQAVLLFPFKREGLRKAFVFLVFLILSLHFARSTIQRSWAWKEAGMIVKAIPVKIKVQRPTLPHGSRLYFVDLPLTHKGAYVFHRGIKEAIQDCYNDVSLMSFHLRREKDVDKFQWRLSLLEVRPEEKDTFYFQYRDGAIFELTASEMMRIVEEEKGLAASQALNKK